MTKNDYTLLIASMGFCVSLISLFINYVLNKKLARNQANANLVSQKTIEYLKKYLISRGARFSWGRASIA
jgi:hypothetical protein